MEQFGRFLDSMEDNSLKMKAKFLDHCNKMSGRELNLYVSRIWFQIHMYMYNLMYIVD